MSDHVSQAKAANTIFQDHKDINRPFTGIMHVLDGTGDTKIVWDNKNADEVDNAEEQFKKWQKKGYLAYTVKKDGSKGEVMRKFDKDAEAIIMSPAVQGG